MHYYSLKVQSQSTLSVFTLKISWLCIHLHSITNFKCFILSHLEYQVLQFRSVMSNSLRPHGLQHARLPCPSPTPGAYPNSCPRWVSDVIQPSHPLSSPSPSAFSLSQHQSLFQWVGSLHQGAKVLGSFSFSVSPFSENSGLISLRIDWCDLFAVQGTLKSLLQHRSSKASVLRCSAFFMVQLSHSFEEEKFFILMKSNLSNFFLL